MSPLHAKCEMSKAAAEDRGGTVVGSEGFDLMTNVRGWFFF